MKRLIPTMPTGGLVAALCATAACGQPGLAPGSDAAFAERRAALVETIERNVAVTSRRTGVERLGEPVREAIASVPRHEFVPERLRAAAYENRPLPIGEGQTISQPYIVALMTELAGVDADSRVLEIGTGSGYQAAVLAEIVAEVYTIEIVEPLGRAAERRLERLGYDNVRVRIGDGYAGWPEAAPFDAVIVTAAPESMPPPLVEQLARGGRLVAPVGDQLGGQSLRVLEKSETGEVTRRDVLDVRFVPFTRE